MWQVTIKELAEITWVRKGWKILLRKLSSFTSLTLNEQKSRQMKGLDGVFEPHLRNSHSIYFVTAVYITVMPRGLIMNYCAKHWKIWIKMTLYVSESLYVKCKIRENSLMQRQDNRSKHFFNQSNSQWPIYWVFCLFGWFFPSVSSTVKRFMKGFKKVELSKILESSHQRGYVVGVPKCLERD